MNASVVDPVVVAVAPNGGRRTKTDHPQIPLTPDELARTAVECLDAGASMIHVHVRKADGSHLLDADAYRAATSAIRQAVGDRLVIQITSEALGIYSPAEQRHVVCDVRPEAVSLALRELVPNDGEETAFAAFLLWLKQARVAPQIILYSPEEAIWLSELQRRGLIPWDAVPVLYVLGRYTVGQTSRPSDLLPFLAPAMPVFSHWSVCAFGRHEIACVAAAALLGGNVRVGFENNLLLPDGTMAASNADSVRAVRESISGLGFSLSSADGLRERWAAG